MHGWVKAVIDWPYSSFHRYLQNEIYTADWTGGGEFEDLEMGER
ncbi:putative transposase [Nitrosomonas aestuarii]|uniref:Putative transposase n=1 Tax=Nitrosomonas aestuarii TaxID=52441 RepID=A0A1I4D2B7_9PROT|nr:putative transposase [Nitrosomonas aestuarii]